jgi:hypothetical protein
MFKFLFFIIFFIILLGLLAGFSVVRSIRRILFGAPPNARQQRRAGAGKTTSRESSRSRKKIFKKDEGEYIDYEEVK